MDIAAQRRIALTCEQGVVPLNLLFKEYHVEVGDRVVFDFPDDSHLAIHREGEAAYSVNLKNKFGV